jgi:tRNA uridine 5-carboxymethylaminomethyl modification enzyme
MPEDVQVRMYRTVPGLEHARIVKLAYATEYDCINSLQLTETFEFRKIHGLFSAGQFNGSSGYEEAAAQGLYAGINAAMKILGRESLRIDRSEGYIGVLVDDLITKENNEPYRMMTSRAEYRLLLRQDNADMRLLEKGYRAGLVPENRYQRFLEKKRRIEEEIMRINKLTVGASASVNEFLSASRSTPLSTSATMAELIRRPELDYQKTSAIDPDRPCLPEDVQEEVNIEIKYEGYIRRQKKQVDQFRRTEHMRIPEEIDYDLVPSLRNEARQKLKEIRPASIGQASRIMGVNPADVSVLMIYLKRNSSISQK